MAASIVVDIKAQITGYKEQIEKIQQLLDKLKIDSSIGKSLNEELEKVQKRLEVLGKNTNIRLSSDNGIDQLTDKLSSVGEKILNITKLTNDITLDDIDTSKLGSDFDELLKKVQNLKNSLEEDMNSGIQQAINNSNELKEAFEEVGQDINSITKDQALGLLENALKNATEQATEAKEKMDELNQIITEQKTVLEDLDKSPFLSGGFDLSKTIEEFNKLKNVTTEKIFDKNSFEDVRTEWINGLAELAKGTNEQKEKIAALIANMVEPKSIEQAKQQFTSLSIQIKNILGDVSDSIIKNGIFGGDTATSFGQKLFHIDENAIENAKSVIKEAVSKFKEAFTESDLSSINAKINNNQIKEVFNLISTRISEGYDNATKEVQEGKAKLQAAQDELIKTEQVKNIAETNISNLNNRINELKNVIKQLNDKLAAQERELEQLNKSVDQKIQKAVEDTKKTASSVGLNAKQELSNAAQAANIYKTELQQVREKEQLIGKIEGVVQRWFSIYAAVRMVSQAIKSVISTIEELDKTITQIAIVTNMTQQDLWNQMKTYTDMARQYAVSISGVYEVSQLYYQQGLQTVEVMALTEETLKMARISGLDYTTATNYMTNAVRSFKMEMQDAQTVVDVYSKISASSATNTAELATAMSKTASSAQAVGSSFENTTAMMAVMIESTRESAENIGSAMKSIISRYGEMTKNPSSLKDSEGEEMSLNKVDKALQTVGITIQNTAGQFREFDDVIMELSSKWDTIDKNTQRYIATVMAGNRQQSRFLALVSNSERLAELSKKAANSQDTATLQVLKTMDSIEAKTQQLKTSLQSLYTSTGVQNLFKGILDYGNNIIKTFTNMPTVFNLPIVALARFGTQFYSLANIVTTIFTLIKNRVHATATTLQAQETATTTQGVNARVAAEESGAQRTISIWKSMRNEFRAIQAELNGDAQKAANIRAEIQSGSQIGLNKGRAGLGMIAGVAGASMSLLASGIGENTQSQRNLKATLTGGGSILQGVQAMMLLPGITGKVLGILTMLPGLVDAFSIGIETATERAKRLKEAVTEANNAFIQKRAVVSSLSEQIDKLKELEKAQNDSEEARQAFIQASNEMASQYPELISGIDSEGNAIINLQQSYLLLADARKQAAEAAKESAVANNNQAENAEEETKNNYREKARIEIGNFNNKVLEFEQQSYKKDLNKFTNEEISYDNLLYWIRANTSDQTSTLDYLTGKGIEIDDRNTTLELFNTIAGKLQQGIDAVDPSNDLKMSEYLADAVKESKFLSNIVSAMGSEDSANELLKIFSQEDFSSNLEEVKKVAENSEDNYVKSLIEFISELYQELLPEIGAVKQAENVTDTTRRNDIGKIVGANLHSDDYPFLKEMNNASAFITEAIYESSKSAEDYDAFLTTVPDSVEKLSNQLSLIWKNLIPNEKDDFNNLIVNTGHYSEDQFRTLLNNYIKDDKDLTNAIIANLYNNVYNIKKFTEAVKSLDTNFNLKEYEEILATLGSTDLLATLDVFKDVDKQIQGGSISQDRGQNIIENYIKLFEIANGFGEETGIARELISNFSDFSLNGIEDFKNSLKNSSLSSENINSLITAAEGLKDLMPINLNTEIEIFATKMKQGMEDFEKALSSASKGMDFKTASEVAAKMGKSVSDFTLRNGQFFINSIEDLKKAYLGDTDSFLTNLREQVNKQIEQIKNIGSVARYNGSQFEIENFDFSAENTTEEQVQDYIKRNEKALKSAYPDVNFDNIASEWESWHNGLANQGTDFIDWYIKNINQSVDNAETIANEYASRKASEATLQLGLYSEFINANTAEKDIAIAQDAFNNADVETLLDLYPQFSSIIINNFNGIAQGLLDKISSESKIDNSVEVTAANKGLINQLKEAGLIVTEKEGEFIEGETVRLTTLTNDSLNAYLDFIDNNIQDPTQKAQERAKVTTNLYNQSLDKTVQEVFKNTNNISATVYEELMQRIKELGLDSEVASKMFKQNGDHYKLEDITGLLKLLFNNISVETQQAGEKTIQETTDDIIKQISTTASLVTKGTFSPKEMQDFVSKYEETTGKKGVKTQDIFNYDQISKQFKLTSVAYDAFIEAERIRLTELGMNEETIAAYIEQLTNEISYSSDSSNNQFKRNAIEVAKTILTKRNALTEEEINNFAKSLNLTYEEVKEAFTAQDNGYYTVDIEKITGYMAEAGVAINDFILTNLNSAIEGIQNNSNIMSSGFSDIGAVMTDFNNLKALTGEDLKFDEIYTIDPILHKYVYTANGLITANNAQTDSITAELEASNTQLLSDLQALEHVNELATTGYGSSTEEIVAGVASEELYQAYQEWLAKEENTGKYWKDYYKERSEQLQNQIENNKILEESFPELQEANKQIQFGKIDFKGIASGTVKFATAYNQFYNYLVAQNDADGLNKTAEQLDKEARELAETYGKGGKAAAEQYKADADKNFNIDVYNDILNQPVSAAQSLFNKIKNSSKNIAIQLTESEAKFLKDAGIDIEENATSISSDKLSESYQTLMETIQEGLENGAISLQTANQIIADNQKTEEEKNIEYADAIVSALTSGKITTDSLSQLASSLNVSLKEDFDITKIRGISTNENNVQYVDNVDEFIDSLIEQVDGVIDKEEIKKAFDLADKSKLNDSIVSANNSVIETLANNINSLKSLEIGKQINLTYLDEVLGEDKLKEIFGKDAYSSGILTVNEAVKNNLFNNFKAISAELKEEGEDTTLVDSIISEYINSAKNEISSASVNSIISAETASVLVSYNQAWENKVNADGKIILKTAQDYIDAVSDIYIAVKESFEQGKSSLQDLNSSYTNIIKANNIKKSTSNDILKSATSLSTDSLNNFMTNMGYKLDQMLNESGDLIQGWTDKIERTGTDSYRIKNWDKFIAYLGRKINTTSEEYINAYITWLDSEANVAPNAKEALMTSLVSNLEHLSYAQIGQIAKTFNMTAEAVLKLVENNGDNTFNGAALLNSLEFDKTNKEFSNALINQKQTLASNLIGSMTTYIKSGNDGLISSYDQNLLKNGVDNYIKGMRALGINIKIDTTKMYEILSNGGEDAVKLAQSIAAQSGQELSNEDIESLYRSNISSFVSAIDTIIAKPGEIVNETTARLIRDNGGQVSRLGTTGQFVVESAANLYDAYNDLLNKMKETGASTLSDLNKVQALALGNRLNSKGINEQQVIDALGDAAEMTFTRFGEILTDGGIQLTEQMVDDLEKAGIIELIGGNKMRITDFSRFAKLMNWEANSDAYVSAFKTYNDSLVQMNRKVEKNITEEIKSISSSKPGDIINLTQLTSKIDESVQEKLNEKLESYGATLTDGLLVLDSESNIPAIIKTITEEAANNGLILQDNMAELADTLNQTLSNYTNLINNAIDGKLTNVEAQQLSVQARNLGFNQELNFKTTAEGLRLSVESAISLYNHLKSIDAIRASLVFDKLYTSITTSNEKLKNTSGTMSEISNIQRKIAENEKEILTLREKDSGKANQIQNENDKLKEQLELYKEINLKQMGDSSSYSFMDNDLPEIFKGAQNYYNSIGKAFSAINKAGENGYMEIKDFYNFINEASNLVSLSGKSINLWGMEIDGSAENTAALIQKGFSALSNIDGEGVKVDLNRLGLNFKSGADGMANDFTTGIKSFAKSQIALIDATIAMLETFVAMEALGEIDVDKNGIFDFTAEELGTLDAESEYIEKFGEGYKNAIEKIKTYFESSNNKDLQNAYNNFKINGHSIRELLNASEEQLKEWGIKGQTLQKLLQRFYELSQSKEFATNPSEIWKQLAESFSDEELSELSFSFNSPTLGEINIENGNKFGTDFKEAAEASAKEFLQSHGANSETIDKSLEESFAKYKSGTASTIDLTAVYIAEGKVEVKDGGLYVNGEGPFQETDDAYRAKLAQIVLGEIDAEGITLVEGHTFEGRIKYMGKEIRVTSDGSSPKYYSDTKGANPEGYNSLEELLKDEYNLAGGKLGTNLEFNDWVKFHVDIKTTIESNLNIPEVREKAQEIANMPKETVEEIIGSALENPESIDGNGNIKINMQGVQVTLENKGSLEQKAAAVQNELSNSLDPDGWITKISTSITNAFNNFNIAQLFIDGLKTSLNVSTSGNTISFTSDPTILALGANLGQGIAAGIATASSSGITNFFNSDANKTTITTPIINGLKNTANDSIITDHDYEISKATATLDKMEINNVKEAGFSSSILSNILKTAQRLTGGSGSDLTLESATATINKLSISNVGNTDLKTQIQTEIEAKVGTIDISAIKTAQTEIVNTIATVARNLTTLKDRIGDLETNSINAKNNVDKLKTVLSYLATSQGPTKAEDFKKALNEITNYGPQRAADFKKALNEITSYGPQRAIDFKKAINEIANYGPQRTTSFKDALNGISSNSSHYASNFVSAVNSLKDKGNIAWNFASAMNSLKHGGFRVDVYINNWGAYWNYRSWAKGNVALSKGTPPQKQQSNLAFAGGSKKTLVGELGPELVVSNGRYYIVGEKGAEMVDLPKDAIVFNHLQTKKLLSSGINNCRGKPITNEKYAFSYATGNISGPALATATQAIAALKQLRAMWESMLNSSAKQLGSQAGKSANKETKTTSSSSKPTSSSSKPTSSSSKPTSSSSKPTSSKETTAEDGTKIKTTTDEIQRWYNLLRQIAKTEKDITYEEKLQTQYQSLRVANGDALYKSYKKELSMLNAQIDRSQQLAEIQKDWYDKKRAELAASAYGQIFKYTEDGLQQYVSGKNKGLDILEKLTETDIWGNPIGYARTAATQLSYIQSLGFNLNDLLSSSDGTKVAGSISGVNTIYDQNGKLLTGQELMDAQVSIMENFWDTIDGWRDELDGLYDSYLEQVDKVITNQNKQNEIMQKIIDNQIKVEKKVYDALNESRQTIINNSKKEMDAYKKSSNDMINNLNNVLTKERELYNNQKNNDELLKLQRQLAILQRSGGSSSQILNLQQQIATKQQDMYFDEKQEQIKALQEASNLQAKKMEEQIELMTETLEYQKNNGLLWNEVISIMKGDEQNILEFITSSLSSWVNQSALQTSQAIAELQTSIQLYVNSRDDDFIKYYNDISSNIENIADATDVRNSSNSMPRYKKGGLIDFTGPAWVDGSPSKPEAILNSDETKFVQNKLPDILNNTDTLRERQLDLQNIRTDWLSSISYVIDTNNSQNNSVNIERVELNMNVEQLTNSADAKRLGQEAFNELLNIARKAGKNSVSRR